MAEIWLPSHGQLPPQPLHTHRPGIFSQLPPSRTGARSFLQRCPLLNICPESAGQNIWICSYGKTFNSMYLLESSSGLGYWNCFRRIKYNKNYIYIYILRRAVRRCELCKEPGKSGALPSLPGSLDLLLIHVPSHSSWHQPTWLCQASANFLLHLGFISCLTPLESSVLAGFFLPPSSGI